MNFRRLAFAALAQMVLGSTIAMAHQDSRGSFENEQLPERDVPLALEVRDKVKDAAERFLGLSEVRFVIVDAKTTRLRWGDTTPSGLAVYPWSFAHGPIDLSMRPPDHILAHEIGHDLFRRYVVPSSHSEQYGTDAPDWLDESVAIAFEDDEQKAERRCDAHRLFEGGELIPLKRFLQMDHPDLLIDPDVSFEVQDDFQSSSIVSLETPSFYGMSLAFPEYLISQVGTPKVLGDVARAFVDGVDLEAWMAERTTTSDVREMERDFHEWLSADPRYRCPINEY